MLSVKYLVIGAGITGLSFAAFCNSDDYLVLEKEDMPGGYCKTFRSGEYVWDYSGHFFHFKDDEMREFFLSSVDQRNIVRSEKCTRIKYNGSDIDYPFQMNIHQLPKEDFIDCLYDLYFKEEKTDYDDFLDMLYGKFGKGIVERFLRPYNEKLYACDLRRLDRDAMGRFFPYADLGQIIKNMKGVRTSTYNDRFMYHKDGAYSFVEVLLNKVDESRILLNESVVRIDAKYKTVETSSGRTIAYEYLVNTMPFNLFYEMAFPSEFEGISELFTANKVLVFNIGFDAPPNDNAIHWMYFPDKEVYFYRVGFYNNILREANMSLYVEVGYRTQDVIDVDSAYLRVLEDLKRVGIVTDQNVVDYNHLVMNPAYVHINAASSAAIAHAKECMSDCGIYSIGRYGSWTYCSIEDCILEARNLAKTLSSEVQ